MEFYEERAPFRVGLVVLQIFKFRSFTVVFVLPTQNYGTDAEIKWSWRLSFNRSRWTVYSSVPL